MITATTPGAQRIITAAQTPGTVVEFDTFDETGHTGTAFGIIANEVGMSRLGNQGYAVDTVDGTRHHVSRYAFVITIPTQDVPGPLGVLTATALLSVVAEVGSTWLTGDDATHAAVQQLRKLGKLRGIQFTSSTGRTTHGTKVITLEARS